MERGMTVWRYSKQTLEWRSGRIEFLPTQITLEDLIIVEDIYVNIKRDNT